MATRRRPTAIRGRAGLALALAAALVAAGCARDERPASVSQPIARAPESPATRPDVPEVRELPAAPDGPTTTRPAAGPVKLAGGRPVAAWAKREVQLYSRPSASAKADRFPARNPWGDPSVFLVRKAQRDRAGTVWLEVLVPRRPNGGTAWVQARWFLLSPLRHRIEVDLSQRRLTVQRGGKTIRSFPVAIGDPSTPTPVGDFFITVKLRPPEVSQVYGAWALGLSGYSTVLDHFGTGDGQIALHGTRSTWSLGKAVSNGCVRLANDHVSELASLAPAGTPVTIQA